MIHRINIRRLARTAASAALRGAVTAAGSAPITLIVWWITHK